METLSEVREYLKQNREAGTECPACDQHVQVYNRTITSSMVLMLLTLYKLDKNTPGAYYHISDLYKGHPGDFSKLRYWGIIVDEEYVGDEKKNSGWWAITEHGRDFVLGRVSVPKHAKIYNTKLEGFSEETISVKQALGKKFNYFELMGFDTDDVRPKGVLYGQENLFA